MGNREQKGNMLDARMGMKNSSDDEEFLFKIIEELQGKIGGIRKKTHGGLFDYMRPRPSLRSKRRPKIEVTKFQREVKCDDLEGIKEMVSLIRRAGSQNKG